MGTDTHLDWDDLRLGDRWERPSRTISAALVAFCAGSTGDNHPIHPRTADVRRQVFGRADRDLGDRRAAR